MIDLVEDSYKPLHELIGLDLHLWCNAEDLDMKNPESQGILLDQSGGNYIVKSHNGRIGSNKACKVSYRKIYGIAVSKEKNINIKKITFFQCQIFFVNDKDPYQYFHFTDVIIGEHCTNDKKFQSLIINFTPYNMDYNYPVRYYITDHGSCNIQNESKQIQANYSYEYTNDDYPVKHEDCDRYYIKTCLISKFIIDLPHDNVQDTAFFYTILMHLGYLQGLFALNIEWGWHLNYHNISLIDTMQNQVSWIIQGKMKVEENFKIPSFIDIKKCFNIWLANEHESCKLMGYIWSTCCSMSDVNYDVKLMLIVNGLEVCWSKLDEAFKHYGKKGMGGKLKDLYNSLGNLQNILNLDINEMIAEENTNNKSSIEPIFWTIAQYRDFFTHFGSNPNHKFNLRLTHNDSSRIYSRTDEVQSKKYTIKIEKWLWVEILQVLGILDKDSKENSELLKYIANKFTAKFDEFLENY